MSSYLDVVSAEINTIQHMLESLPFDRTEGHSQTKSPYFLDVYRVHRPEMQSLNDEDGKFPLDASKLLKLGISLGNLLKSLQQDEEQYVEQQRKQQQFNKSLGGPLQPPAAASAPSSAPQTPQYSPKPQLQQQFDPSNPFADRKFVPSANTSTTPASSVTAAVAASANQPPPNYQTRFVQNLMKILKNYDVGAGAAAHALAGSSGGPDGHNRPAHLSSTSSSSTISQQVQASPIKLSSKQLLIEKLEINIELDNLFTYKIVLKLVKRIYEIIEKQLSSAGIGSGTMNYAGGAGANGASPTKVMSSSSSIFSTASYSSTDSSMTLDEYLSLLKQIVTRISVGIIEPFVSIIVSSVAEKGIIDRFGELLKSLD